MSSCCQRSSPKETARALYKYFVSRAVASWEDGHGQYHIKILWRLWRQCTRSAIYCSSFVYCAISCLPVDRRIHATDMRTNHLENTLPSIRAVFPEYFPSAWAPEAVNAQESQSITGTKRDHVQSLPDTAFPSSAYRSSDVLSPPLHDISPTDLSDNHKNFRAMSSCSLVDKRDIEEASSVSGNPHAKSKVVGSDVLRSQHPETFNVFPRRQRPRHMPLQGGTRGEERRHECPDCHKRFYRPSHLATHMNSHTGARPFECPKCGRSFNVNSNMLRHLRSHASSLSVARALPPIGTISHYALPPLHPPAPLVHQGSHIEGESEDVLHRLNFSPGEHTRYQKGKLQASDAMQ